MTFFSLHHATGPCDTCGAIPSLWPIRSFSNTRRIDLRRKAHHRAQAAAKGFASIQPGQDIKGVLSRPCGIKISITHPF